MILVIIGGKVEYYQGEENYNFSINFMFGMSS